MSASQYWSKMIIVQLPQKIPQKAIGFLGNSQVPREVGCVCFCHGEMVKFKAMEKWYIEQLEVPIPYIFGLYN